MSKRMTAREVRERLRGKVDPGLLYVLEALAEQDQVFREQLMTAAETINQIVKNIEHLININTNLKTLLEKKEARDDDEPVTN